MRRGRAGSSAPGDEPGRGGEEARGPGRPRESHYDELILREALREIGINGIGRFSVQAVAKRAGVAKGTVTLRWPDREALILEALGTTADPFHMPLSGSLRSDVRALVRLWSDTLCTPGLARTLHQVMVAEDDFKDLFDRYMDDFARPANRLAEAVINEARRRGEVRDGVNSRVVSRMLVGAVYIQAAMHGYRVSADFERTLTDLIVQTIEQQEER